MARQTQPPREVATAPVGELALPVTIAVTGVLAADDAIELGFQVAGRVGMVGVDIGDAVAAGQLLAALDPRDFELGLARARGALMAARARLGIAGEDENTAVDVDSVALVREALAVVAEATLDRDRTLELVRKDLGAQSTLDTAKAALEVAQSRLQKARDDARTLIAEHHQRQVDVEIAQKNVQDARLLAPWAGRVGARHQSPGSYVRLGDAIVSLLRVDRLRLQLRVPERQAARIAAGQTVRFTVDGLPPDEHEGTVTRLGAAIDARDRTRLVEAMVDNPAGALPVGGFCRADVVVAPAQAVLAVPEKSIQSFAGVDRVFVVQDGKVSEQLVELGRRHDGRVEVRSGLTADQRIVVDPRGLVQGTAVVVKD